MSLVYVSFDGWTTKDKKKALTGICVHYIDAKGQIRDFLLALLEQLGEYSGFNYADTVGSIIFEFGLTDQIGWFIMDNAYNNDTAVDNLAIEFGFNSEECRVRCVAHIFNLVAQSCLFGKDKDLFENEQNINVGRHRYHLF